MFRKKTKQNNGIANSVWDETAMDFYGVSLAKKIEDLQRAAWATAESYSHPIFATDIADGTTDYQPGMTIPSSPTTYQRGIKSFINIHGDIVNVWEGSEYPQCTKCSYYHLPNGSSLNQREYEYRKFRQKEMGYWDPTRYPMPCYYDVSLKIATCDKGHLHINKELIAKLKSHA